MIHLRDITIAELKSFIESDEFRQMPVIPVSRHRAWSHIHNPLASGDDKILFLAYDDNRLIGYLGAMPDCLDTGNKQIRTAWLSCMWVDSSQRGKGIAPMLLTHAHEIWAGNLLITNFIPVAKRAYDKTGLFTELKNLIGVRGYLRFNLSGILIEKNPVFRKFKWLLKISDNIFNLTNEIRLTRWKYKYAVKEINFEYVNYIDEDILKLVSSAGKNHLSPKNRENLEWLIQFPWILNTPFGDLNNRRYIFSSMKTDFRQYFIKLYDNKNEFIAFLVLTQRDGQLKTPYLFFDEKNVLHVIKVIYAHALSKGIKTFTTYHPVLTSHTLSFPQPFIFKKKMNFRILAAKQLIEKSGISEAHYFMEGDGDAAFV